MGRKAKITAVPMEQKQESITCRDDEGKTDAQHMTDIINEVNAPEVLSDAPMVTDQEDAPVVVAKAKAKRASRAKPAVEVEPEVEVTASLDEVEAVVRIPSAVLTPSVSDHSRWIPKLPALTVGSKWLPRP
jgi:hypothetical protein